MQRKFFLLILILLPSFATADNIWITKSLNARLIVQPIANPEPDGPSFRILLELRNNGIETSNGNLVNGLQFYYGSSNLKLRVTDEAGRELAKSGRDIDELGPADQLIALPFDGVLTFPIGDGGEKPYKFSSGGPGKLLTLGPLNEWIIPQGDGHTYSLSGVLSVGEEPGERRFDWNRRPIQWNGKVDLAKVEIPKG